MDLVDFSETRFSEIEAEFDKFAETLEFRESICIPMSALDGDNVTNKSDRMAWYQGPTLLAHLETVDVSREASDAGFRLPVQWVNRPNLDFRGFSGTIASGSIKPGDEVINIPSGKRSRVKSIVTQAGELAEAVVDQAVTLTLEDEIDVSRGDVICGADYPVEQSDQFAAHVIWMSEKVLFPGRQYRIKTNNQTIHASVTTLKHKVNVNTLAHEAANTLELNEIGVCNIGLARPVAFDAYRNNRQLGSFILIDRQTNETVGAGMLDFSLRRAANVVWQDLEISKAERAEQKHQRPCVLWFTGLSGSGKSTIANLVEKRLFDLGRHTYTLDGDNVRHGLNNDLGFTDADRVENIRRVSEVSRLMADSGLITLCAFISPFRAERQIARQTMEDGEFIEVYVNTPLSVAEQRDMKGLYAKARKGEIKNFTGIDSEYQAPMNAEVEINTVEMTAEQAAEAIVAYLTSNGYLHTP
jgi:bifunctional enzyme CysN/CysC